MSVRCRFPPAFRRWRSSREHRVGLDRYQVLGFRGAEVIQTSSALLINEYPGKTAYVGAFDRNRALQHEACRLGLDELGFEREPRLTYAELRGSDRRVAGCLAEAHRELAASLPLDSRVRALALRCGDHWGRLAGLPHGLTRVDR
jgi:hypothetical protein